MPALSLLAVAGAARLAPAVEARHARLDAAGAGLVASLAAALVLLLQTPSIELPTWALIALPLVVIAAAATLTQRVRAAPDGFIPAAVVRSRRYVLGALAALTIFARTATGQPPASHGFPVQPARGRYGDVVASPAAQPPGRPAPGATSD